ncbi:predicted protein, partial [Nematostella vectensis]
ERRNRVVMVMIDKDNLKMTKYTEAPPAIKWVVIIIHFIFLIFGIILIAVGAWVEIHAGPHSDISAFNVLAGNRVLMFTGCVLALISLAGIVAAIINSKVFLIIAKHETRPNTAFIRQQAKHDTRRNTAFIREQAKHGEILRLYANRRNTKHGEILRLYANRRNTTCCHINRSILADLKNRIKNFPGPGTRVVDSIQERLQCCGADSGPNDWMNNKHFLQSASVPDSCCKQEYREKDCGLGQIIANTRIHTEVLTMPLTLLMFCKIKEIE